VFLGKQSGFGFNKETELYQAPDSVWNDLNKAHPQIIWHKTHIMPFQEDIGFILHDVQANSQDALTLEDSMPVGPQGATSVPPRPSVVPLKRGQTPYKKSKKRAKPEDLINSEKDYNVSQAPPLKKIDLGTAISGLSKEMKLARKAKETFQTNQQKALKLLKTKYKVRLNIVSFIRACSLFKDKGNAVTFTTLTDVLIQDQ
jgi:hypothetical protein